MYCVHCGSENKNTSVFCTKCGKMLTNYSNVDIDNNPPKSKVKIILPVVGLITLAIVILLCYKINTIMDYTENDVYPDVEKEEPAEKVEHETVLAPEEEKIDNRFVTNVMDFTYEYGVAINADPVYTNIENQAFLYSCDVPSHFVYNVDDNDKKILYSPDNTAIMCIYSQRNLHNTDTLSALNDYIHTYGGKVEYKANGDDWFAVKIFKGNICYYRKCFVDDYIRWFDFVFPIEYIDVYDDIYISHIEDNFKRNDQ